ncbi:MAG: hypothetical protein J6K55_06225 [Clostridia bacterium]|nr:hypothetical protein [Clostridia bacterium]
MRNYIRADVKRILQRSSHLFSMLLLFALYVIVLYLPNRGMQVTSVTLIASACSMLDWLAVFFGLFEMLAVFSEDFKVKTMQVAIGLGVTRNKVVICKLLETIILMVLDCIVIVLLTLVTGSVLGASIAPAVMMDLVLALLVKFLLAQAVVVSITMIVMFMTQSTILSLFVYILTGLGTIYLLLSFMPMFGLTWLENLNLGRLTLSYNIGTFYSRLVLGSFDFLAFLIVIVHLAAGIIATCKLFQKSELDF